MDQYPLRNIDDDLWRRVRVQTTADGISVKFVLVRALELYAEQGRAALWPENGAKPAAAPRRRKGGKK